MKLLVFAHRGEAQIFLKELSATAVDFSFEGLFQYPHGYILITGEGIYQALEKTCSVLGRFDTIDQVWNLGVAGALRPTIEIGRVYPLRTLYALTTHSIEIEFQSFTSQFEQAKLDCVSSPFRVLDARGADCADHFAPLVDREAWGIARACQLFKVDFYPAKLASDRPNQESGEICQMVKESAELWSDQLYRWFTAQEKGSKTKATAPLPQWEGLYFTVATERQLRNAMDSLMRKGFTLKEIEALTRLEEIQQSRLPPKNRAKRLLNSLQDLLNPVQKRIRKELEECASPLKKAGFQVSFDSALEREQLSLHALIQSPSHLNQLKIGLEQFSFHQFTSLMRQDPKA